MAKKFARGIGTFLLLFGGQIACGDGSSSRGSEKIGPNGEQITIVSPADGETVKAGSDLIIKIHTENVRLVRAPEGQPRDRAMEYWQARNEAESGDQSLVKQSGKSDAAEDVSTAWVFHSIIAPASPVTAYVARYHISKETLDSDSGDFIYSIPAAALIEGFSEQHLTLALHSATGEPIGAEATVKLNVEP